MRWGYSRRTVLKAALGAAATAQWHRPAALARTSAPATAPGDKLRIACIGVGGQGCANLDRVAGEHIAALCDVDDERAAGAFNSHPQARRFHDWRRLLDEMRDAIDAVVISTPDHMHAPIALAAMQLGKHVYCEKPLTRMIDEARRLAEAARRTGLATQMGNGGNATAGARANVELIRAGVLGPVREVHAWSDRPGTVWPQGLDRPAETPPVPATLHWDLWLGVAPERPYHPAYHPARWRGWWDFGTGALGDMGCHICNVAFWALDLRDPTTVRAEVSDRHPETGPVSSRIIWEFPARGDRPAVRLFWYDGGRMPPPELVGGRSLPDNGSILVGDRGTLLIPSADGSRRVLLPEDRFAGLKPPEPTLPRSPGHHAEWIAACKDASADRGAMSRFERAAVMTEALLLGNVAIRAGREIAWDAQAMKVTNAPEADAFVRAAYRPGWS